MANRVVFPQQFEFKLSWNATLGDRVNNTNYIQGHIKIDQKTNRMSMDFNFSTLSLAPQELVSYMVDFEEKYMYLKQKHSCKYFDIAIDKLIKEEVEKQRKESGDNSTKNHWEMQFENFPNIAELFNLFPYVMYFNRTVEFDHVPFNEFKFSYPLGKKDTVKSKDSEFLMYFNSETMDLNRIQILAHSLNISNPLTIYANQPITEVKFAPEDMLFKNVKCNKATDQE